MEIVPLRHISQTWPESMFGLPGGIKTKKMDGRHLMKDNFRGPPFLRPSKKGKTPLE
jgi:hypothetical protein